MFIFAMHNNSHYPNYFYKFNCEGIRNIEVVHEIIKVDEKISHSAPLGMLNTQL